MRSPRPRHCCAQLKRSAKIGQDLPITSLDGQLEGLLLIKKAQWKQFQQLLMCWAGKGQSPDVPDIGPDHGSEWTQVIHIVPDCLVHLHSLPWLEGKAQAVECTRPPPFLSVSPPV